MSEKIETEAKIKITSEEYNSLSVDLSNKISKVLRESLLRDYTDVFKELSQTNIFYKNAENILLRMRIEQRTGMCGYQKPNIYLTHKTNPNENSVYKSVNEDEIEVAEGDLENLLKSIGFEEQVRYQKKRTNFIYNECAVSLDILPNDKRYIEIEGEEKNISEVIQRLGLQNKPIEKRSYLEILRGTKDGGRKKRS
ncbi:class IV adenylate cyclase [Candidatus Pacearchaeota archaeon]|nr:class IV adenylate cyclase [Candidatus Pacearchaeota archaeon]